MDRYEFQNLLRQELYRMLRVEEAPDGHVLTRRESDEVRMAFEAATGGGGLDPIDPYAILANNTTSSAAPTGVLVVDLPDLNIGDVTGDEVLLVQNPAGNALLKMKLSTLTSYIASVLMP